MATGETVNITSDLTLTGKFEMTKYDDTLNIIDVTVTLSEPAGDLFTNEGNDTVTVTGSTLTATSPAVSFMLGSGDDTLILSISVIDAKILLTGVGGDTVRIDGEVTLKELGSDSPLFLGDGNDVLQVNDVLYVNGNIGFGDGDDILEISASITGAGDIDFGDGTGDTLRFNGGILLASGSISNFSVLEVSEAGGSLGRDLTVTGADTAINYNGNLFKTANSLPVTITIADSTTALSTADGVSTDVTLILNNVVFTHSDGGSLEFTGHTGYAITASGSTVSLHDLVVESGQVLTGSNTVWSRCAGEHVGGRRCSER